MEGLEVKIKKTQRGFALINFTDRYGQICSLQKSSLAGEDCIWFGVDVNIPKEAGGEGKTVNDRMHLTQKQVKKLLPYLNNFIKTGEL